MIELKVVFGWIFQLLGIVALIAAVPLGLLGWFGTMMLSEGRYTTVFDVGFVWEALGVPLGVLAAGVFLTWFGLRLRRTT